MRQGRLNVATWVIVNGRLASGGCAPALICAFAPAGSNASISARIVRLGMYVLPSWGRAVMLSKALYREE